MTEQAEAKKAGAWAAYITTYDLLINNRPAAYSASEGVYRTALEAYLGREATTADVISDRLYSSTLGNAIIILTKWNKDHGDSVNVYATAKAAAEELTGLAMDAYANPGGEIPLQAATDAVLSQFVDGGLFKILREKAELNDSSWWSGVPNGIKISWMTMSPAVIMMQAVAGTGSQNGAEPVYAYNCYNYRQQLAAWAAE